MSPFTAKTIVITATMLLQHSPKEIFPLLCPVREYDWIEQWDCDVLYTESGVNELGCIFKTYFPDQEEEIWVTSRFEPDQCVEFVRTSANKVVLYKIDLETSKEGAKLLWTQKVIGISETGNERVESSNPDEFTAMVKYLEKLIDYYLTHGEMYRETDEHADNR
jgi:hypothetical protein